jgi:hypothetical protein
MQPLFAHSSVTLPLNLRQVRQSPLGQSTFFTVFSVLAALFFFYSTPFVSSAIAAETATIKRDTTVYADSFLDSKVIGEVKAGEKVTVQDFKGSWVQIRHAKTVGWIRTLFLQASAASLELSKVSQLDSGRRAENKLISTTGIRSLPKASRHALIITIGDYAPPEVTDLKGVRFDAQSAQQMAEAMSIPLRNMTFIKDSEATEEGVLSALADLKERVRPGDRVFVYYSGHGTRWIDNEFDPNSCTEGLITHDGKILSNRDISQALQPIGSAADKLMVFYDACHSGGVVGEPMKTRSVRLGQTTLTPKFSGVLSSDRCSKPSNMKTRSLSSELGKVGFQKDNVVFIAASRPSELSFDDPNSGGLATQSFRDCLLGEAQDLDASGAVSVAEITVCAQKKLDARLASQPEILGQKMTVGGNPSFVPSFNDLSAPPSLANTVEEGKASGEGSIQAAMQEVPSTSNPDTVSTEPVTESPTQAIPTGLQIAQSNGSASAADTSIPNLSSSEPNVANKPSEVALVVQSPVSQPSSTPESTTPSSQPSEPTDKPSAAVNPQPGSPPVQPAEAAAFEPTVPTAELEPIKPAALLDEIFQQRDAQRELKLIANPKKMRIKRDRLGLEVTPSHDGYLYLALAGSDNKSLYFLFPNELDGNNVVKAGQPIKLPARGWRIRASGPEGANTVLAIVTDSPRDLSGLEGEASGPFVKTLLSLDGNRRLQSVLGTSGNADQSACQEGGKTRNLTVEKDCSDSFSAARITIEEVRAD